MPKSSDLSHTCCQILGPPPSIPNSEWHFSYNPGSGEAGSVGSASTLGGAIENRNCLSLGFDDFLSPLCWQTMFTRCFSRIHRNISFRCCLLFNAWFSIYVQDASGKLNFSNTLRWPSISKLRERSHELAKKGYGHWALNGRWSTLLSLHSGQQSPTWNAYIINSYTRLPLEIATSTHTW